MGLHIEGLHTASWPGALGSAWSPNQPTRARDRRAEDLLVQVGRSPRPALSLPKATVSPQGQSPASRAQLLCGLANVQASLEEQGVEEGAQSAAGRSCCPGTGLAPSRPLSPRAQRQQKPHHLVSAPLPPVSTEGDLPDKPEAALVEALVTHYGRLFAASQEARKCLEALSQMSQALFQSLEFLEEGHRALVPVSAPQSCCGCPLCARGLGLVSSLPVTLLPSV